MNARRYLGVLWLLLTLAGCSGSGSSGFDAIGGEGAAIQQALDEQRCVPHGKLTICPADTAPTPAPTPSFTPTPTMTPTPPASPTFEPTNTPTSKLPAMTPTAERATPTTAATFAPSLGITETATPTQPANATDIPTKVPTPAATATARASSTATRIIAFSPTPTGMRIDTGVNSSAPITCVEDAPGGACSFVVPFAPAGFPATAVYRLAVRVGDSSGSWAIGGEVQPTGASPGSDFEAPVTVPPTTSATGSSTRIQIAVLVFLQRPQSVPAEVHELGDSGADFAFVTAALTLQPVL